jgi:hypothetical protein
MANLGSQNDLSVQVEEHAHYCRTQTFHGYLSVFITQAGFVICSAGILCTACGTFEISCLDSIAGNFTVVRCSRLCHSWGHWAMEQVLPDVPHVLW